LFSKIILWSKDESVWNSNISRIGIFLILEKFLCIISLENILTEVKMKKYIFLLALSMMSFYQSNAISGDTFHNTWRCGNNLIEVGDDKGFILSQCGEPTFIDSTSMTTSGAYGTSNRNSSTGGYAEITEELEEWYYNCGSYGFNTYLIFKGSRLFKIRLGTYGRGESYCDGIEENPINKQTTSSDKSLDEDALTKAQTEQIEEETYQMRMKAYDDRIKALNEEAAKAKAAYDAGLKEQEEKNKGINP
jgi:hypothetical protein